MRFDWKEQSKLSWNTENPSDYYKYKLINLGSIQRIADALEKIAESYPFTELDRLRRNKESDSRYIKQLERRVAAYKGIVRRKKR